VNVGKPGPIMLETEWQQPGSSRSGKRRHLATLARTILSRIRLTQAYFWHYTVVGGTCCSDFARRRSGVRIPSAPLLKPADLQVKCSSANKGADEAQPFLTTVDAALGKHAFHRTRSVIAHSGAHVRIGIQHYRHGGVAQESLDVLGMHVGSQQWRRAGAAQAVEAHLR
jgi:hypothetical protein